MTHHPHINTLGKITFAPCGETAHELFRVNADVPLRVALEQASQLLYLTKRLSLDAATERNETYAWAAHYLSEMAKAVVDDLCLGRLGSVSLTE